MDLPNRLQTTASSGNEINTFGRLRLGRERMLNSLRFLVKCKNNKTVPRFIQFKCKLAKTWRISRTLKKCYLNILKAVIKDKRSEISKLECRLYNLHLKLATETPLDKWAALDHNTYYRAQMSSNEHQAILIKKWHNLSNSVEPYLKTFKHPINTAQNVPNPPTLPERHQISEPVVNLSGKTIPPDAISVLQLGLNFAISKPTKPEDFIAPIERTFKNSKISAEQLDTFRQNIKNVILHNHVRFPPHISNDQRTALKAIKDDPDLIILPADKGGKTVILHSNVYKQEVTKMMSEGPYVLIEKIRDPVLTNDKNVNHKRDPILTLANKTTKLIKSSNFINRTTAYKTIPSTFHAGRMYALPKVHKINSCFRPIISNIGMPTYQLSKFLAKTLAPLQSYNTHSVKNSKDFVSKLRDKHPDNCLMVSFDIKSMYTNIPINGALSALKNKLFDTDHNPNDIIEIMKLTEHCITNTIFSFDNHVYKQTDGLAMGNPLAPILSDIYMDHFESVALSNPDFNLEMWIRYVDDTFTLFPYDREKVSVFLDYLNSIDSNIQFTVEIENNNILPFLDVLILKDTHRNIFHTGIYRKPFSVPTNPHYLSNHPLPQKISTFYTLVKRALSITSNDMYLNEELSYLKTVAQYRGFNPNIINHAFAKFTKFKPSTTLLTLDKPEKPITCIPFDPDISFKISKILSSNFRVIFKPKNKLSEIIHNPKDKIPHLLKWGVYEVKCVCGLAYIGQTKRFLKTRLKEHITYIRNKDHCKSTLAKHAIDSNHSFLFENAKIINSTRYPSELDTLETIEILKNKTNLVNNDTTPYLHYIWKNLFINYKAQNSK